MHIFFCFIFEKLIVLNSTAKHYSVIPLGAHSGLISWVDGMTPIFALYKKWQQRQAASPKKEKCPSSSANAKNTPPQPIARPSELYFQKLTPLLSKHNMKATQSSRKEWPVQVLKEVLAELTGNWIPHQHHHYPKEMMKRKITDFLFYLFVVASTFSWDASWSSIERAMVCWLISCENLFKDHLSELICFSHYFHLNRCYSTNAAEWRQVIRNVSSVLRCSFPSHSNEH